MRRILTVLLVIIATINISLGQSTTGALVVSSAVPFLSISPDSRAGSMGEVGVATSSDINSQHWNPAKFVFNESKSGIALSYSPWLRNLVDDMNLGYLTGYHQLDDKQALSGSLRYFNLGEMQLYNDAGQNNGNAYPNEFALDMAYSRKLSENWSGAVALRYILSDIYNGSAEDLNAGSSFAADVAFLYTKKIYKNRKNSVISSGINISNIGSKISYDNGSFKDFIPTNLRVGAAYTTELDKFNKMTFSIDLNKLLVPSPVIDTSSGVPILSHLGNQEVGPIAGIFISFADAPNGLKEELREVTLSFGAEYWYSNQFAVRLGYFHESGTDSQAKEDQWKNKGSRQFLTVGAGLKMNVFSLDFSYIYSLKKTSPLDNTLRFTLGFDLDDFRKQGKKKPK